MSTPVPTQGGFTQFGFTVEGFTLSSGPSVRQIAPSWLSSYYQPWRAKLEIFDKDGVALLAKYDSFEAEKSGISPFTDAGFTQAGFTHRAPGNSNSFNLEYLDCEPQVGNVSTGTWSCIINDSEERLDRTKIGIANRVRISMGQTQNTYRPVFQGVTRFDQTDTSKPNTLRIFMSGFGTQYLFNERLITYHKVAQKRNVGSTAPFVFDRNFVASEHVKSILSDVNALVSNTDFSTRDTLQSLGPFDVSNAVGGIENINVFEPGISSFYIPASNAFNQIADIAGAEWGIDTSANRFYFRFPQSQLSHDSIVVKSMPDYGDNRDTPDNTSYIMKGTTLQIGRSIRREDGFANKLFALAGSKQRVDASSTSAQGSTSLSGTAIAQQVRASSTKLRDLAFTLSKSGTPEKQFIDGRICLDSGFDFPAENKVVADFQINTDDISTSPTAVYKLNLNFAQQINPGDFYWIILYQVTDSVTDSSDTVAWHHDNVTSDNSKLASATRVPGAKINDPSNPQSWTVSLTGPTYSFASFYASQHIITASDPFSIAKYGEVDDIVTNTAIKDNQTMTQYLYTLLAFTAKPKLIYPSLTVSIPQLGFKPGQLVQIIDRKSGNAEEVKRMAEVISVRYVWDARSSGGNTSALGITTCDISLLGYFNFLDELDELEP